MRLLLLGAVFATGFNTLRGVTAYIDMNSTVETDVLIVGGGATGTFAAVRLREDYGKKVLLVEKDSTLGGHTSVWTDPVTGKFVSYGVEVFNNLTAETSQFFNRFNIPVERAVFPNTTDVFADFRTGQPVNYAAATPEIWRPALERLREQWVKYDSFFLPNTEEFPAATDIPEDLLMSWPDFARKYNVEAATQVIHTNVVQDPNKSTVMDMYRAFDTPTLGVFLGTVAGVQAANGNNGEIFQKSMDLLGNDVLYNSEIISSKRSDSGVEASVRCAAGTVQVKAKRILITIQPDAASPESLDFDDNERDVLSRSAANQFFVGLVSHPSLPPNTRVANAAPESEGPAPANYLPYPSLPALASFRWVADSSSGGVYRTVLSGPPGYTIDEAKQLIRDSLQNVMDSGMIPAGNASEIDFKAFEHHGSMYRSYAVEDLKDDIIAKLNTLQGQRSTWRTGASWGTTNIGMLWTLTETVLKELVVGL